MFSVVHFSFKLDVFALNYICIHAWLHCIVTGNVETNTTRKVSHCNDGKLCENILSVLCCIVVTLGYVVDAAYG